MPCDHQEADSKILAALMEGEEDRRLETARRERAIADAASMKRVIEEQLQLEREREAEFDLLHRSASQLGDEIRGVLLHFEHGVSRECAEKKLSACGRNERLSGRRRRKPENDSCGR